MKLRLKPHDLITALMTEMQEALRALESGDYDGAFAILELRCRPEYGIDALPRSMPLGLRRQAAQILADAPAGLVASSDVFLLEVAAGALSKVMGKDIDYIRAEDLVSAMNSASAFGTTIVLQECGDIVTLKAPHQTEELCRLHCKSGYPAIGLH